VLRGIAGASRPLSALLVVVIVVVEEEKVVLCDVIVAHR